MNYKSIRQHPQYEENPFIENAIKEIEITKRTKVQRATNQSVIQHVVNQDGELTGHTAFLQYIEVDEEKFAKIYLSQFASFWELSKPAIRVFGYIITMIKPNQDRFIFRMDEALKHTKYTHENSILTGLSSLVECKIIARTRYDWEYFINPLVAFNGNRVTFAKTYVKKKKSPDPAQLPLWETIETDFNKK
jgi:hypothetical protein